MAYASQYKPNTHHHPKSETSGNEYFQISLFQKAKIQKTNNIVLCLFAINLPLKNSILIFKTILANSMVHFPIAFEMSSYQWQIRNLQFWFKSSHLNRCFRALNLDVLSRFYANNSRLLVSDWKSNEFLILQESLLCQQNSLSQSLDRALMSLQRSFPDYCYLIN